MSWVHLEHLVWSQYKKNNLNQIPLVPLVVTVSGGLDSMALLECFKKLNLQNKIIVAHFHHGKSDTIKQNEFRDSALTVVEKSCPENFEFVKAKAPAKLCSEADFRRARLQFIQSILNRHPKAIVVTGHHQNDLLETYFLKLIRGSGSEGLKSFKSFNGKTWRPFLNSPKTELARYARSKKLQWVDDPSNIENKFLRNWLRREFFPLLENKQSGAVRNLFKSLDRLVRSTSSPDSLVSHLQHCLKTKETCVIEWDRLWYSHLSTVEKEKVIFLAFKRAQTYKYQKKSSIDETNNPFWDITSGRVNEICKRLDKNQKELKFKLGQLKALTTSQKIMLEFKM